MFYRDISLPDVHDPDDTKSILLVDDWNDIQRRVDIRLDALVAFSADWGATMRGDRGQEQPAYLLELHTTVGKFKMLAPKREHDDSGQWFADILDDLAALLRNGGRR